jgi:aspartyl-tRNA(Asn)/glutamyl-tRNA(Gln) amidotransferase subunit A
MNQDLAFLSLSDLVDRYRTKALSPVDVTRNALDQLDQVNGSINAFSLISRDRALADAQASEQRWLKGEPKGLLDGVPISVKDTLMVKGFPFRRGSRATSEVPVAESAPVVDHAFNAGAVMLGITTTPEFGAGPLTISPLTGITRNPWDLGKNSGGSSGGAAASMACGVGYAALATDAGGSIRIPSSFCGVVGFKSTGGRVPTYPPNVAGTLSSPGAITRNVRDAALMADLLAALDLRDPEQLPVQDIDIMARLDQPFSRRRIAFTTTMGYAQKIDPEVSAAVIKAARHFESLGFIVEEADPGIESPIQTFLAMFRPGFAYTMRNMSEAQMGLIGETLRDVVTQGRQVSVLEYLTAQDERRALARKLQQFHSTYALLLTPTVSVPAFTADQWVPDSFAGSTDTRAWTPFAFPFNLTQQPAISVPCGLTGTGLPIGLQIVGPRFADAEVLAAAHLFETTSNIELGRPPLCRQ